MAALSIFRSPAFRRLFGALALAAVTLTGCGTEVPKPTGSGDGEQKNLKRIILITNGDDPFWKACETGMNDGAKKFQLEEAGYRAEFVTNNGKVNGQISLLKQYASQSDVAAIGISIISPENAEVADQMRSLRKQGIKVITVDSDLDRKKFADARALYIGTDNLIAGRALGQCVKQLKPNGGDYVTFVGYKEAQNARERIQGFAEGCGGAGANFKSLDSREDRINKSDAIKNVLNALNDYKTLSILVGIYSYNGPAIVDEVKRRKNRDKMTIVTFDAHPQSLSSMKDGMIDAMVIQDPYHMGYYSVQLLKALLEDDKKTIDELKKQMPAATGEENVLDTAIRVVVPNDKSPIKKEMFKKGIDFYTLDEFKKWMEERGLTSS